MPRVPVYTATTPAQVRALASPIRLEILAFACAVGPCSLPELARASGRPADALYRHARVLLKHHMLVPVAAPDAEAGRSVGEVQGRRRAGRRAGLVVDAAAEHYRVDYDPLTGRGAPAFRRLSAAALKAAQKALKDCEGNPGLVLAGPERNFGARAVTAWLTPEQLRVVVGAIDAALGQFERGVGPASQRPPGAALHHFTYVLAPVVRRRSASGRGE
jgi:hypothetical protein